MKHNKLFAFVTVLVLVAILAACAPPPTPEMVVETVTVVETVIVQGETVVQEKIITATPEPTMPPMDEITLRVNWSYYGIHGAFIYGVEQGCYDPHSAPW